MPWGMCTTIEAVQCRVQEECLPSMLGHTTGKAIWHDLSWRVEDRGFYICHVVKLIAEELLAALQYYSCVHIG